MKKMLNRSIPVDVNVALFFNLIQIVSVDGYLD